VDTRAKRVHRLKQTWPGLLALFGAMVSGMYRWSRPEALWGQDVTFTFLVSNPSGLISISQYMQLIREMPHFVRKIEWSSTNVEKMIVSFTERQSYLYAFDIGVTQLLWITCFVDRGQAILLVRSWEALSLLRDIHLFLFSCRFLKRYRADLETVARYKGNLSVNDEIPGELLIWMSDHVKKAQGFRNIVRVSIGYSFLYKFFPLVWDLVLAYWTWGTPLTLLPWTLLYSSNVFNCYIFLRRKERLKAERDLMNNGTTVTFGTRNNFQKHLNANGDIERTRSSGNADSLIDESEDELI